jgi:tetratricopeptide (TPR) repeat protein
MMGKALRLMTRIMATLVAVALFLLNGHEIANAALQIETALRLRLESASTWLLNGRNAWLAGKCSEAREAWRRAMALAPQNRIAWLLYLLSGPKDLQPEPAVAEGLASYFDFQGDGARSAEKWEEALEWYEKSFSLVPDVSTANRLESVYLKLERKGEAIACWEELAESLPETDPEHWWALGRAAELREDWEEAARAYGHGAELAPKPYDYWMRQGANYERLKEWGRAEGAYRKAVEARPDIPYRGQPWQWAVQLGDWLAEAGDKEGALAAYRQALEWKPEAEGIEAKIQALEK